VQRLIAAHQNVYVNSAGCRKWAFHVKQAIRVIDIVSRETPAI